MEDDKIQNEVVNMVANIMADVNINYASQLNSFIDIYHTKGEIDDYNKSGD